MFVYFLVSIMALIIGHSQVKYFNQYVQDNRIKCFYSSGCKVEDLLTFPTIQEVIPAASVSIDLPFHSGHPKNRQEVTRTDNSRQEPPRTDKRHFKYKFTILQFKILFFRLSDI